MDRQPWNGYIGVSIGETFDREFHRAEPLVWTPHKRGEYIKSNTFNLEEDEAQELADALYAVGIRPSAAAGSAGQLASVQYHLEDMRKLTAKLSNTDLK
jgi:hypothetical protein